MPAKLCSQRCSKCMTHSCILTQTAKVISCPPLQHPAKLPGHRLVHFSLLHTIINNSLDSSFFFFVLACPVSLLHFVGLTVPLPVLTGFCVLEFAIALRLQHKLKLAPQSHLCNHPSIVPLEALDVCFSLLCDTQKPLCCICYKSLNTRAQTNAT